MATESRIRVAKALHKVMGAGQRVPDTWDAGLASEDAGLAQALLGLSLRHWGRLGGWVRPRLKTPGRELPTGSRVSLAMGLAQLAWLDGVSDHAAVHESVDLASDPILGFPPHRGLVNALLRQASRDRAGLRRTLEAQPPSLDRTPFVERALLGALEPHGLGAREQVEVLWARLQKPHRPLYRALTEDPIPEGLEPHPALQGALRSAPGTPFPRDWVVSAQGMVQDLSSQALLDFAWEGPGPGRILDVCAAPGGKTTLLGRRWPLAELVALEADATRAKRLEENLTQRGVGAEVVVAEATAWLRKGGSFFDLILLDAPCSGSGTLQKHPELPWLGERLDLPRLTRLQSNLLEAALSRLAPGGLLIYAVCSWLPEEGEAHRTRLVEKEGLSPVQVWPETFRAGSGSGPTSFFRPNPLHWEGEGFQAFAFRKD